MFQKKAFFTLIISLILIVALAACSSPLATVTQSTSTPSSDPAKMTVVSKLGVGILEMEGSSQAVTTSQANTLLPLWKAVYKMGNDKSANSAEVSALYEQIQSTLTADQISSIEKLTWTQQELSALTQKYGSTPSGQSASASTSTSASSSSQQSGGGPSDMGGGGPMGDITSVGLNTSSTTSTTTTKSSSSTAKVSQTSSSSNLNPVFASAIITILKQRISAE